MKNTVTSNHGIVSCSRSEHKQNTELYINYHEKKCGFQSKIKVLDWTINGINYVQYAK